MKKELSATVRIIRWKGQELRYEEGDRYFIHEMLSHNLGMKNATLVQMQQTRDPNTWQCAILDLNKKIDYDTVEGENLMLDMVDRAKEAGTLNHCFLIDMPRANYENILKERRKHKNNVFDLFMGYQEEIESPA